MTATASTVAPAGRRFDVLFERAGLPHLPIPQGLADVYGTGFGLSARSVLANFVASVDGVVALPVSEESGHIISGSSAADRFVMALLRSSADVILVGAGTFRKSSGQPWDAESIYPEGASLFSEMRIALGLSARPKLVLLTESAKVDATRPDLGDACIITTTKGAAQWRDQHGTLLPNMRVWDTPSIRVKDVVAQLQREGHRTVLSEGGPSLLGKLIADRGVDELFVTLSPTLFGRATGDGRKSLVEGVDLAGTALELMSARSHGSHLFLRYRLLTSNTGSGDHDVVVPSALLRP